MRFDAVARRPFVLGANGPAVVRPMAREVERRGAYDGMSVLPLPGHDYGVALTKKAAAIVPQAISISTTIPAHPLPFGCRPC